MLKITNRLISEVSKKAEISERKRSNYNFHRDYNDGIQRFLNARYADVLQEFTALVELESL